MPSATLPNSPIQRFSNAYFRKKAAAQKISTTATQPSHFCPITNSICRAGPAVEGCADLGGAVGAGCGVWITGRGEGAGGGAGITGDGGVSGSDVGGTPAGAASTAGCCRINRLSAASTPASRI